MLESKSFYVQVSEEQIFDRASLFEKTESVFAARINWQHTCNLFSCLPSDWCIQIKGVRCLNANVFIDYANTNLHLQEPEATSFKL